MGFRISNLKTDAKKEVEGNWVDFGSGLMVKVARIDNIAFMGHLRKISRKYVAQSRTGDDTKTLELLEKLRKKAMARFVLLDWSNMEDDDGKPIEYSPEKALELFDSVPEFYRGIIDISSDAATFKAEEVSESLGNSLPVSNGSSP